MDSDDDDSYIIEAERKAKQNYLTEEILESNYDPELFMMFCGTKKGADIDMYSFEELQDCVHQFKMTYRRGQSLKEVQEAEEKKKVKESPKAEFFPQPVVEKPKIVTEKAKIETEKAKIVIEKPEEQKRKSMQKDENLLGFDRSATAAVKTKENAGEDDFIKSATVRTEKKPHPAEEVPVEEQKSGSDFVIIDQKFKINCIKAEENALSTAEILDFQVGAAELIEGGFFSSNYYLYPVTIPSLNWESKHRFSDFVWLREMLYQTLPSNYIPPIPPHKSRANTLEELLYKRRNILSNFLEAIGRNKLLLKVPPVEDFFKIKDYKEFVKFMKTCKKKMKKPENVEQFITDDGEAHCDLSYQGPRADKLADYTNSSEHIEKRIKRCTESVISDIKTMQTSMSALSELVHQLEEVQNILPCAEGLKKLYANISGTFSSISTQEASRSRIFKDYYNLYFKYSYLEKSTLKDMLKERDSLFSDYTKAELKQKNLEKCRSFFGFANIKSLEETEKVIRQESLLMNKHFIKFAKEKAELATELHGIWSGLIQNLSTI